MHPKVMIIEDDEVIREIYALKLEMEGFPTAVAENGRIALDRIQEFGPEVILLDMMMPVMGGLEFMKEFRTRQVSPKAEVIVFSNISAPGQMSEVMQLGASDYWVKSDFTPEKVVQEIRRRWGKRA